MFLFFNYLQRQLSWLKLEYFFYKTIIFKNLIFNNVFIFKEIFLINKIKNIFIQKLNKKVFNLKVNTFKNRFCKMKINIKTD